MKEQGWQHRLMRINFRTRRWGGAHILGDMTKSEFLAVQFLLRHSGDGDSVGVGVSQIARWLEVSPPAVSRLLRDMEKKGWIERNADRSDRRNVCVKITPKGKEAGINTHRQLELFADRVRDSMGEQDMETLLTLLDRLVDTIEQEYAKLKEEDSQ